MNMIPVVSTNLSAVGYDAIAKTLVIAFYHGGVYEYYGVPKSEYTGLLESESKGKYFHAHIKDVYDYVKIG